MLKINTKQVKSCWAIGKYKSMVKFRKGNKISQLRQIIIIILAVLAGVVGSDLANFFSDASVSEEVCGGIGDRLHLVTEVIDGDTIIVDGSTRFVL